LPLGIVALIVSRFTKIKYSVILHGMDFAYALKNNRKKWITRKILNNSKNIICANSYVAKLVKNFLNNNKKIIIVKPGISKFKIIDNKYKNLLINKYNLQNKIILLSIGRLVKRKGFDKTIMAMPKILEQVPNLIYFIAGEGPDENYLKNIITKTESRYCPVKINDKIIFLNKVNDDEKLALFDLCLIFLFLVILIYQ